MKIVRVLVIEKNDPEYERIRELEPTITSVEVDNNGDVIGEYVCIDDVAKDDEEFYMGLIEKYGNFDQLFLQL